MLSGCGCSELFCDKEGLKKLAALNPLNPELEAGASSSAGAGASRATNRRTTAGGGDSISGAERLGGTFTPKPNPDWIKERYALVEKIKEKNAALMAAVEKPPITVTLPDGKEMPGVAWETTPLDVAGALSKGLMQAVCVASVKYSKRVAGVIEITEVATNPDGDEPSPDADSKWETWDASRPLEGDCELQLIKFEDPRGKEVFWHSTAHMLGQALEDQFSAQLTHGPPTENGFFYDSYMGGSPFADSMKDKIEKRVQAITGEKQEFNRVIVTKEEALEIFANNPFKKAIISSKLPEGSSTTVYQNGTFVDLCRGPHVASTGRVKAFTVTKNSASLWLGKQGNDQLQRVYGIAFPDKKEMAEWKHFQEEAAKRDHRKIGLEQELFFFDELSPGSCFFLPHGGRLYGKLQEVIREQYWERNYMEVVTPNMYNLRLWETSGHAAKYKENMFCFPIEGQEFGLKPMNCPGHCVMFKHRKRSYRELPMRLADFGVLHRNELSGALTGLTRVRRFQQDDAHIFCTVAQIKQEVANVLDMIQTVYGWLGMSFNLKLSTRPENFLGEVKVWDQAEALMTEALNEYSAASGHKWTLNPGDGAFYGPKIDVQVMDALKRAHQCATVQLDFVQPMRFDLKYQAPAGEGGAEGGYERPVMVHRAVLGSVERMIAILTEHFAGKWPFFLSPRQALVVPVSKSFNDYAQAVQKKVNAAGFYVDVDLSARTLNKMVREAQLSQYNYILVVGGQEEKDGTVNVRTRDNEVHGTRSVDELIAEFQKMAKEKTADKVVEKPPEEAAPAKGKKK